MTYRETSRAAFLSANLGEPDRMIIAANGTSKTPRVMAEAGRIAGDLVNSMISTTRFHFEGP